MSVVAAAAVAAKAMNVDDPTPEQSRAALLLNCEYPENAREALDKITIENSMMLSRELQFLKELRPLQPQTNHSLLTGELSSKKCSSTQEESFKPLL